jgi:hypothetical protein
VTIIAWLTIGVSGQLPYGYEVSKTNISKWLKVLTHVICTSIVIFLFKFHENFSILE